MDYLDNSQFDWKFIVSLLALLVSIISLRTSRYAAIYSREIARQNATRSYIEQYNSEIFQEKVRWIIDNLKSYLIENNKSEKCGLTNLNSGKKIAIKSDDSKEIQAGDLCKDVLYFFNFLSRDIKRKIVNPEDILEEMMPDMISIWDSLSIVLQDVKHNNYYKFYRRRYSLGSLVNIIRVTSNSREASAIIRRRWSFR